MFPGRVDPKAIHNIKQIALIIYTDVYKLRNLKKNYLQTKLLMKLNFNSKVPSGIFFRICFQLMVSNKTYIIFNAQIINMLPCKF